MIRNESLERIVRRISRHPLQAREHNDIYTFVQRLATAEPLARVEIPAIPESELPCIVETFRRALRSIDERKHLDPSGILKTVDMLASRADTLVAFPPFIRALTEVAARSSRYVESVKFLAEQVTLDPYQFHETFRRSFSDPAVVLQLDRLLTDSLVGSYRVLFPVVDENDDNTPKEISGYLLSANIRVTERVGFRDFIKEHTDFSSQRSVFVLPWSVFYACDDKHRSFSNLCDRLPGLVDNDGDTLLYWIDFQALRSDDIDEDKLGDLREQLPELTVDDVVRAFTPTRFGFTGNSMGLAIGIGAWAASQQRCVIRAIATGHLQDRGTIGGIDYLREKLLACSDVNHITKYDWLPIIPGFGTHVGAGTRASVLRGIDMSPREYTCFHDIMRDAQSLLTDGFDHIRNVFRNGVVSCRVAAQVDTSAQRGGQHDRRMYKGTAVLSEFESARSVGDGGAGFCRADVEAGERLFNDVIAKCVVHRTKPRGFRSESDIAPVSESLQFFSVPFGAKPFTVASWLVAKLCEQLWQAAEPDNPEGRTHWRDLPVVLPVSIQTLAGECEVSAVVDAQSLSRLCKAVEQGVTTFCEAVGHDEEPSIDAEALRIACRRPGKLVLIAYDAPSLEVPFGDEDTMSHRLAALQLLRAVADGASGRQLTVGACLAWQTVVAIVPDEHYKRWAEHKLDEWALS